MRRITILLSALLLALAATAAPAIAFQPPGEGAHDQFDCIENEDGELDALSPVRGHPGTAGLFENDAHVTAHGNSDGSSVTAWKPALDEDNPVGSSCG